MESIQELNNKSINIFGTKYKIKFVDKVFNDNNNWIYGAVNTADKEILISKLLINDKPVQKEELEISLYHEIVHSILLSGQYMGCSDDEPLVEWIARCIVTLKKQGIFKV